MTLTGSKGIKKMKKIIATLLLLTMALFAFGSCQPETDDTQIKVGFLAGPTGIGMAKMINDYGGVDAAEQYDFVKYTAPKTAIDDVVAGKIDITCVSTEAAAKFYNEGSDIQVLAINCLNSVCLLTNDNVTISSISDLEGKTIYTCMQGTPKLILKALLDAYGINATIAHKIGEDTINTPDQIAPVIVGNKADIILSPVHVAYNAMANPKAKHSVALDIDALWDTKFDTPIAMGCIVARKGFVDEHPVAIENFLTAYKASIEYMATPENNASAAQYVIDSTVLPNLEPAKGALTELKEGLKYIDGTEMKTVLKNIYNVYGLNVIGGKLPDDGFYYEK